MIENGDWAAGENVSDEELLEHLRQHPPFGLDGVWHPQTVEIAKKLDASNFDLNRWWCLTPADWECSACGRIKPDIARINQHGELTCRLVKHHDHMDRYIATKLGEYVVRMPAVLASVDSLVFAKRSSHAVAAFDQTIICEDCNNVDTKAKRKVKAHPDFSFSPSDVRQFVVPRQNKSHEIDDGKLANVWHCRERQLQRRFELADRFVELAATNEHWYEPVDRRHSADPDALLAAAQARLSGPRNRDICFEQFLRVSAPKPLRAKDRSKWRREKPEGSETPPNEGEVKHVSRTTHSLLWNSVPVDWACPWCERNKFEIIRPSREYSWSFAVNDTWDADPKTGQRVKIIICGDCQSTRVNFAKEVDVETLEIHSADLKAVIVPKPHSQHGFQSDDKSRGDVSQSYWARYGDRADSIYSGSYPAAEK